MSDNAKKVVVLGAGMVGAAMARDLADDAGLRVDVADVRPEALERVAGRSPCARACSEGASRWAGLPEDAR